MRFIICLISLALLSLPATASEKVALVIGNTDYEANYDLANPVNDARDITAALSAHGFEVTTRFDVTRENLITSLQDFRSVADKAEIALVYYSGHGMEFDGENYLIPVDAKLQDSRDIPETTIALSTVLRQISGAQRLKMVVLDACRNNPFAANMISPTGKKFVNQGLSAPSWQGDNTLIAYAAAAGSVTPDGDEGGNSPYTAAFLDALAGPPRDVGLFMRVVGAGMRSRTGSTSLPFVYSSIPPEELILNAHSNAPLPAIKPALQSAALPKPPQPNAPTPRSFSENELALLVQKQLNRHQCGTLTVDGVFGRQSQAALARYYEHSGTAPVSDALSLDLLETLEAKATAICPLPVKKTTVRTAAKVRTQVTPTVSAPKVTRPDPVAYSYVIWPARSVRHNARVSKTTTHGRLTCIGGRGSSIPRKCNWH